MEHEETLLLAMRVYYSILVIVGLPANVLTLYIVIRRCKGSDEDKCTSSLYLIALAVADSMVLITIVLIYQVILSVIPPGRFCPYINTLDYGAHNAANWIIVVYTIERFIGVYFPVWKHKVCNPNSAKLAISAVFLLSYTLALPHFFSVSPETKEVRYGNKTAFRCDLREDLSEEFRLGLIWGQSVLSYMLPFLSIIVLNGLIIFKLRSLRRVGFQRVGTSTGVPDMTRSPWSRARTVERSEFPVNSGPNATREHSQLLRQREHEEKYTGKPNTAKTCKYRHQSRVTARDHAQPRSRTDPSGRQGRSCSTDRSRSEGCLSQMGPSSHGFLRVRQNRPCTSEEGSNGAVKTVRNQSIRTGSPLQFSRFARRSRQNLSRSFRTRGLLPHGQVRSRRKPILILITVSVVFVVLWFPRFVVFLILRTKDQNRFESFSHKEASDVATMLGLLNSAVNMFLYSFVDSRFRRDVFKIISCGQRRVTQNLAKTQQRPYRLAPSL